MAYELAQLNIGTALGPMDSKIMEDFSNGLDPVNETAENSNGFVWRLKDESGNATELSYFDDPNILINMSVWKDIASLKHFMFKTHHIDFLKQRKRWFKTDAEATYVLWWVRKGHIPSVEEALQRLKLIRELGDTAQAFSFGCIFPSPSD